MPTLSLSDQQPSSLPKRRAPARSPSLPTVVVSPLPPPTAQPITARMAAAGSRRAELEALLRAAPANAAPARLRTLLLDQNVAGKTSAASRAKVWQQLTQRYLLDPRIPEYRAFTSALDATSAPIERGLLLFLMLARTDRLFRSATLAAVSPYLSRPGQPISTTATSSALEAALGSHLDWTSSTRTTACQHVLSALKDFGLLAGGTRKRIARLRPGAQVTLFALRLALLEGLSQRQTLSSIWFQLLGLNADGAWGLVHAAARMGLLRAQRQADVIELELPPLPPAPHTAALG